MWFRVHAKKFHSTHVDRGMEKENCDRGYLYYLYTVYLQHIIIISHSGGMQEWVTPLHLIERITSIFWGCYKIFFKCWSLYCSVVHIYLSIAAS